MTIPIVVLAEKNHGKSTLIGRLLYETSSLSKDRISGAKSAAKKIGKRFEWAHLLDSFQYEREHEMTLDTTRALVKLGKNLYEFIDVPGHRELIKNMLTGASEARFAILVIDIKEGIKPQTLRHLEIAEFLGIEKIIVAVNKIDAAGYSEDRFKKAAGNFSGILAGHGFRKKISIIPISAFSGNNVIKRTTRLGWFKGSTLAAAILKDFKAPKKNIVAPWQSKTSTARPVCIFIDAPKSGLILESATGAAPVRIAAGFQKVRCLQQVALILDKPLLLGNKFVIKQKGKIIGICRI